MAELTVVMPVYNEEACIAEVVTEWEYQLDRMAVDYEILVLNDGSRDSTAAILEGMAAHRRRLRVVTKPNSGHGPTILEGYRQAAGPWVFQVDSDGEIGPNHFPNLWASRAGYDLLSGTRLHRKSALSRQIITAASRMTVRLLFGGGVTDVNCPYRLWRTEALQRLLGLLPTNCFAPNVVLSGLAIRARLRTYEEVVVHRGRRTGKGSLLKWTLWKSAFTAFVQTLHVAWQARRFRMLEESKTQ